MVFVSVEIETTTDFSVFVTDFNERLSYYGLLIGSYITRKITEKP